MGESIRQIWVNKKSQVVIGKDKTLTVIMSNDCLSSAPAPRKKISLGTDDKEEDEEEEEEDEEESEKGMNLHLQGHLAHLKYFKGL